jgi:DNA-binding response OmpR family regulator
MTDSRKPKVRIDEILIFEGLVTEDQIKQALAMQKEHGGRLGSHLIRNGWLTESGLVRALSKQYDCEGVMLSEQKITADVLDRIPAKVAIARTIIPFAFDASTSELRVACEDPTSEELLKELEFVADHCKVRLYIAAESALKSAIARYYTIKSADAAEDAISVDRYWDTRDDTGRIDLRPVSGSPASRGSVLMVTDDLQADSHIRAVLESAAYHVVICDSADDAIDIIGNQTFHTVFIRDSVSGDYLDLIDRLRKISPRTRVRYYSSADHLVLDDDATLSGADLLLKNLDLFTTLLSSKANLATNHAGTVGQLVDRLCRHIGLPDRDRLVITNAAYIHDLAGYYYGDSGNREDFRAQITLTIKMLDSINYSPLVIGILRAMYVNLREKFTKRLPIETLGGNILTIVDIFCDNIPLGEKISLDKFDKIRRKFHDLRGKLFLPEVVEAFLVMIQGEVLASEETLRFNQVLLFCTESDLALPIEARLKSEGFRVIGLSDLASLSDLYRRGNPDMVILYEMGSAAKVTELVERVTQCGIDITVTPTFLLTDRYVATHLTSFLDRGIEDLIAIDNSLNLLVTKIRRVRARIESKSTSHAVNRDPAPTTGAIGNLMDMNLIDLLQALGPSRRTVKLIVSDGKIELVLFLNQGQIAYAKSGDAYGAEAVYEALGWSNGFWTIQPVTAAELPPSNNEYSNESILMEGCRRLDETRQSRY